MNELKLLFYEREVEVVVVVVVVVVGTCTKADVAFSIINIADVVSGDTLLSTSSKESVTPQVVESTVILEEETSSARLDPLPSSPSAPELAFRRNSGRLRCCLRASATE
ncbi:hypothetical protein JOB18_002355 [Solea senegalensis]|uniref:Secreted protein n=1 Tax=Solea senegalensis TaxID=28829 RepID=A0AAV6RAN9_SOLSE|nr:hypothetical protein JOB18_002355 [Solea senegalensis]